MVQRDENRSTPLMYASKYNSNKKWFKYSLIMALKNKAEDEHINVLNLNFN